LTINENKNDEEDHYDDSNNEDNEDIGFFKFLFEKVIIFF